MSKITPLRGFAGVRGAGESSDQLEAVKPWLRLFSAARCGNLARPDCLSATLADARGSKYTGRVILLLLAVVAAQILVGAIAARGIRSEDDFLVAGRRLGLLLASSSIFATWFGAESCIGAAGSAYSHGLSFTTTEPFAYGICLVLMGLLFAAPLWRLRVTTLADFFAMRFGRSTERIAALLDPKLS